jgi:transposase
MQITLSDTDRAALRRRQKQRRQKQRRDAEGYVKVTVVLLLDTGRAPASIADDLGLDVATVYRYAQAFAALGLDRYLAHERPGYWGLLTSSQLAHLCREVNQTLYPDVKGIQQWLEQTDQVGYCVSGLTQLLHHWAFATSAPRPCPVRPTRRLKPRLWRSCPCSKPRWKPARPCSTMPMRPTPPTTRARPAPGASGAPSGRCPPSAAASG